MADCGEDMSAQKIGVQLQSRALHVVRSIFREPALCKGLEGDLFPIQIFPAFNFFFKFKNKFLKGLLVLLFVF